MKKGIGNFMLGYRLFLLSLCFLVFAVSLVMGATLDVCPSGCTYTSIQTAINAASAGDIILVGAGTYIEDLSIPASKTGLELAGEDKTTTKIKGIQELNWPNHAPAISVLASWVKIHGFTIESPNYSRTSGNPHSSGITVGSANVEIYDNIFSATDDGTGNSAGWTTLIETYGAWGGDVSGLYIHDNFFTSDTGTDKGSEGIYINYNSDNPTPTGTVTIENNIFGGQLFRGITSERSKTTISGNIISSSYSPAAVFNAALRGIDVSSPVANLNPNQDMVSITSNTVTGFWQGIRMGGANNILTNFAVTQNTLQLNDYGLKVYSSATGVIINNNNILGNSMYGVENIDMGILDAEHNYWGAVDGPSGVGSGSGDAVSTNVDYTPWYVDLATSILSDVYQNIDTTISSRSSQWSVDKVTNLLKNDTFGLEEIKKEVSVIESEVTNGSYGLEKIYLAVLDTYYFLSGINFTKLMNLDALVSSRASQQSVDDMQLDITSIKSEITNAGYGLEEIKSEVSTIESEILDDGHWLFEIKDEIIGIEGRIDDLETKIDIIIGMLTQNCGNDVVDTGETCDDGNQDNGDGCDSSCQKEECGNGKTQFGEQCDDGNQNNKDGCKNDCTFNICGDGHAWIGKEQCDDGDLAGQTCQGLGFDGGALACQFCQFDTSGCYNVECYDDGDCPVDQVTYHCVSNNVWKHTKDYYCANPGQQTSHCDYSESDVLWDDCQEPDQCVPGNPACQPPGPVCGDGVINGDDECDGSDLGGLNCEDFGYDGGMLGCTPGCLYDESGCCDIECYSNSDCGTDSLEYVCVDDDVYEETITYDCLNAGSCSAECDVDVDLALIDDCGEEERCVSGNPECQEMPENPFDAILVTDLSGSMSGANIGYAIDADLAFVDLALDIADTEAGLVGYSTIVVNFHELTDDKTPLEDQINSYVAAGKTCISCGMDKAIDLASDGSNPIQAMVVLADGPPSRCIFGACTIIVGRDEVIAKANEAHDNGIKIYSIALGPNADEDLMEEIATIGEGSYYYSDGTNLVTIYENLVDEIGTG